MGDLGTAGQMFGQVILIGDEPAEIDDPLDTGLFRPVRHDGGRAIVRVPKVRLPDAVHQVIDDVDGTGRAEGLRHRRLVVCIQFDTRDVVIPAELGQPAGISGGGHDVMAGVEQGSDEPRTDIAGRAGDQDSHGVHRTAVPESPRVDPAARLARGVAMQLDQRLVNLGVVPVLRHLGIAEIATHLAGDTRHERPRWHHDALRHQRARGDQ